MRFRYENMSFLKSLGWTSFFFGTCFSLIACDLAKTQFGGTKDYVSQSPAVDNSAIAQSLLASNSFLFLGSPHSVTSSGFDITKILNGSPSTSGAGLELTATSSGLATIVDDAFHIAPGSSQQVFMSNLDSDIQLSKLSVFMVLKPQCSDTFSFDPLDRTNQAFQIGCRSGELVSTFFSSPSDYHEKTATFTGSNFGIVGMTFTDDLATWDLSINGTLTTHAGTTVGTPGNTATISRYISVGPSTSGDTTDLKEVYVFNRDLSRIEHGAIISYLSKKHGIAVTLSPELGTVSSGPSGDPNYAPAQAIIESKCLNCHAGWSGANTNMYVNLGLITKGNANASKLYYRLIGSAGSGGPKTMPSSGSISAAEVEVIRKWIAEAP